MRLFNQLKHFNISTAQEIISPKLKSFFASNEQEFSLIGYYCNGIITIHKELVEYVYANEMNFALIAQK
jgi:hypothetical protein